MSTRIDCPNGCGEECEAVWVFPDDGTPWGGDPYRVPAPSHRYHFSVCRGSFDSGAAFAFGIVGMGIAVGSSWPSGRELALLRAARAIFIGNRIHPSKLEALRVAVNRCSDV